MTAAVLARVKGRDTYFDVEILVDLDSLPKQ